MRLHHFLTLAIFLFGHAIESQAQAKTQVKANFLADFETFFHATTHNKNIPGAAFVIVGKDHIQRMGVTGYTRKDGGHPVDTDTVFRLASVSKTFAGSLTGMLVSDGQLQWNEPVTRYAPRFRINGATEAIQLQHVLGQSTGLPAYAYDNYIEEGLGIEAIYAKFRDLAPVCPPGSCYSYQNSAFSLIQPAIESAAEASYGQLIEQRIFNPLAMNNASVGYESFVNTANHAEPHEKRHGQWHITTVKPNYYRVAPAAGINASISDLATWLMAHLGARPDVLHPFLIDDVTLPRVQTKRDLKRKYWRDHLNDAHYGLGWRIYQFDHHELIYHGGWVSGFRTDIAWSREYDLGLAILTNAEGSAVSEMTTHFWSQAFKRLKAPDKTVAEQGNQLIPSAAYSGKAPAAPGKTTGLSKPSEETLATPKK